MKEPRFEVYLGDDEQWRWRLVAPNGEVMASGEAYTRRYDCERAVEQFRVYAVDAEIVRLAADA